MGYWSKTVSSLSSFIERFGEFSRIRRPNRLILDKRLLSTHIQHVKHTVETVSYFVSEGPGSALKAGGRPLDRSLFIDTELNTDSAPSSSSSTPLISSQSGRESER